MALRSIGERGLPGKKKARLKRAFQKGQLADRDQAVLL
jgi:hypothetical protein